MKNQNIKKIMKLVPVSFALFATPIQSFAEDSPIPQMAAESPLQEGLLSYYFKDLNFKELSIMTNQQTGNLSTLPTAANDLSDGKTTKVQSAYWQGRIQVDETGEYSFETSADKHVRLWIDGKQIINQSTSQQKIQLEKNKLYDIKIEYQNDSQDNQNFDLKLYWTTPNNKKEIIPPKHFLLPEMKNNSTQSNSKTKDKRVRFARAAEADKPTTLVDTDNDGIPDSLETSGYTVDVRNGKLLVVPWLDSIHSKKELTKYYSSPLKWSTTSDPYSDFQKVTGMLDKQVKREARNPLVAAYPIVNVDMEQIVLSKNKSISLTDGGSNSNTVSKSTSTSTTDSISTSVSAEVSASLFDIGAKVSTSFSTEHSSTVTLDSSTANMIESNWSKTIGINEGEAAYLAAGIRYNNQGTAPIYEARPTNNIVLGNNQPIATVKAKENQLANVLGPGNYYPTKLQTPILLNAKDDFGSSPITLNLDQLNILEKEKKLTIETDQVTGKIGKSQANGELTIDGDWSAYIPQIEQTSARIILEDSTDEDSIERRVAAIDSQDSQEKTKPEVTLKEALKLAFDTTEKDGDLYYKDKKLKDQFELIMDEATAQNISEQLKKMENKDIFNVKLNAKMNILVKDKVGDTMVNNLFTKYSHGYGLKADITQNTINEIQGKINKIKNKTLKNQMQRRVKDAQVLLELTSRVSMTTTTGDRLIIDTKNAPENVKVIYKVLDNANNVVRSGEWSWEIASKESISIGSSSYSLSVQLPSGAEYALNKSIQTSREPGVTGEL
ncbi:PA14 domain-containing protein [Bacillus cereus]|uniref:binary toxin-like calcium binding domain-containing protein n=1 Tax=Bacillus cereus TaxID=1396 RepID=UPI002AC0E938|nr:binary toxin-like calcium binding domain-containing protein [Bacillus cereus]MDZ4406746.1 PA14 domain-containing protein [Bacillus cereus]MDZ4533982.1 PA14 domain-containing protein [Bacillus cereus]